MIQRPALGEKGLPAPATERSSASSRRALASGSLSLLAGEGLLVPAALVTAAYLGRRLGPDGYGRYLLAASLTTWVETVAVGLFVSATLRLVADADWLGSACPRSRGSTS